MLLSLLRQDRTEILHLILVRDTPWMVASPRCCTFGTDTCSTLGLVDIQHMPSVAVVGVGLSSYMASILARLCRHAALGGWILWIFFFFFFHAPSVAIKRIWPGMCM
jgi:hypothetical protein